MLDELKFRYRNLKPWARFLIVCVLGLLPGAWNYLDSAPALESSRDEASTKESTTRQKLATAKAQVKDLAAMEEKLRTTREQLKKAEKLLPNEVFVDEILQFVSQSANESDVTITKFEPTGTKLISGDYPYSEVRFKVSMEGKYGRLGEWLDIVGGNEARGYVKSWSMKRGIVKPQKEAAVAAVQVKPDADASKEKRYTKEDAIAARDNMQIAMDSEIVYYTAASEAQLAEVSSKAAANTDKNAKTSDKAKDAKADVDPKAPKAGGNI